MVGYKPINIKANKEGLIQNQQDFLLPEDAYPNLTNAFIFRNQIKRKQAFEFLGRLRRVLTAQSLGNIDFTTPVTTFNIFTLLDLDDEVNAQIQIQNVGIAFGTPVNQTIVDISGNGILTVSTGSEITSASINYQTGVVTLLTSGLVSTVPSVITFGYFPGLPVMGLRTRELDPQNQEMMIAFDTKYSYEFDQSANLFTEFLPDSWNGDDWQFFWSTNYWTLDNQKIFWVTNFNITEMVKDPIRFTNGTSWIDFAPPTYGQLNQAGTLFLTQARCILPFRSRLLMFNTWEGSDIDNSIQYSNRIRWSEIGDPLATFDAGPPVKGAWLDDVRGKGGFLDIPTNQDIISVGFVRDNVVVFCERSTWQLRYTGRSIAPFQIEKINSELGCESTFSPIQFDKSIIGVGDVGIVECDSYSTNRIDQKIPDLVFQFQNDDHGTYRVHGIRDFVQKVAYIIYPYAPVNGKFPDKRLVYNYDNDSWAIFTDSLTCMGTFQPINSPTWNTDVTWEQANFLWIDQPSQLPLVVGGNQQGYVLKIGGTTEGGQTTNDQSLFIQNITGFGTNPSSNPIQIISPNHNMPTGFIISIQDIPDGTPFSNELNGNIFQVNLLPGTDTFFLTVYNPLTQEYNLPALAPSGSYVGGGQIRVRDNFNIVSKKFNFMDIGQQIQLGWVDILMDATEEGAISMNIYTDYNEFPSNVGDQNASNDTFFNNVIPTNAPEESLNGGNKNWMRVICPTNANFITIEYTLNNEQMQNACQESDVEIDAQILYMRPGGRQGITS